MNRIRWCDCGNPKPSDTRIEECGRCAFLDAGGRSHMRSGPTANRSPLVIAALRTSDGLTLTELCVALGANTDWTNGRRSMLRLVQRLMAAGRLRRYWDENHHAGSMYGNPTQGTIGQWRYCLAQGKRRWSQANNWQDERP
jgi:hypothetical protein